MIDATTALLVFEQDEPLVALREVLESQGLQTRLVRSVSEVKGVLQQRSLPVAVFSATALDDGTWADVLFLAAKAAKPVPVIVVSRNENIKLHITALEKGAADFIVPPFGEPEIAYVLRCATGSEARSAGRHPWAKVAAA